MYICQTIQRTHFRHRSFNGMHMQNNINPARISLVIFLFLAVLSYTLPKYGFNIAATHKDSLTPAQMRLPENALKGLSVAYGLQVQLMATEPMLQNPTNIDVDERGRIWVTEAYNYRPNLNGNPTTPNGDRIMILEDRNGDAKIDTAKLFYQGPEINAPLGIAVLGKRVIVAQSPYVWNFYDDNGDDKADRKEIMFQGIEGEQHDHGMHTFSFGPDGKLYFNFGNNGKTLKDSKGNTVLDQDGDEIGPKKYKQGMVFRCDPDGSRVECLGDNFRNPYEVAVDSYGTMWQSDNDDDGNKGTRINYVMPYGNYGYTDEITGAGWNSSRTNMEDSIPLRHWHLNDPGAVPNVLQTGAGSPTGLLVYEGTLLPEAFQHQLIHADAGPNVVRAYSIQNQDAGYGASIVNILKGENDRWFRPADVCVAPDGSLIVADWYDPGVGGHQAGDQTRGRIYRVAPAKAAAYTMPSFDFTTVEGAMVALQNANLVVRYHAFTALQQFGKKAISPLEKQWKSDADPALRARAFWSLVKMPGAKPEKYIKQAQQEKNPQLRMLAIRASLQLKGNTTAVLNALKLDPDPQVRRECIIALHHNKSPESAAIWATLATQYDGKDRWYLEALGIGADGQWDAFFSAYLDIVKDPTKDAAGRDLVWRARTEKAVPYLAGLAADGSSPLKTRLRYFRAFDFNDGPAKTAALLKMVADNKASDLAMDKLALFSLNPDAIKNMPAAQRALKNVLDASYGTRDYLDLVALYNRKDEQHRLLEMAIAKNNEDLGRTAAKTLIGFGGQAEAWKTINETDNTRSMGLLNALSKVGNTISVDLLQAVALGIRFPEPMRKYAAVRIGKSGEGEKRVLEILKSGMVPEALIPDVVEGVGSSWRQAVRIEARSYLPKKAAVEVVDKVPTIDEINAMKANATNGKAIFASNCAVCHKANGEGLDFGPALSEIGSKYAKDAMLKAIVYPSEGISFGYEGWVLKMKDGSDMVGIMASKTKTEIELKMPGGMVQKLKTSSVKSMEQMKVSMMPAGLHASMSAQEMADLLSYLDGLKRK